MFAPEKLNSIQNLREKKYEEILMLQFYLLFWVRIFARIKKIKFLTCQNCAYVVLDLFLSDSSRKDELPHKIRYCEPMKLNARLTSVQMSYVDHACLQLQT